MEVQLFNLKRRRQFRSVERAADRAAAEAGRAEQRQQRNSFVPGARDWRIETVPEPLSGEVLD